jgi:hypothetical protein
LKILLPTIEAAIKTDEDVLGRRPHYLATRATELRETLSQPVQSGLSRTAVR